MFTWFFLDNPENQEVTVDGEHIEVVELFKYHGFLLFAVRQKNSCFGHTI